MTIRTIKKRITPVGRIRAAVFERANDYCESRACQGWPPKELDHAFGRAKVPESVSNCWALCGTCHRRKTDNDPSAAYWVDLFMKHAQRHGYVEEVHRCEARLLWITAKGAP